jgi:putative membrane protein
MVTDPGKRISQINKHMENFINLKYIIASILYSFIGILILLITFWIIEKLTPENLWKEILINKNMALAVMASAFMIAMSIIIASAIHG